MRTFAAAILAAVSSAKLLDISTDFTSYIAKFGKEYKDAEEYNMRLALFEATEAEIRHLRLTQKSSQHGHN
jgi:hypothetical protein